MESRNLYQDDLTEERSVTPAQRDAVAHTQVLDPDVLGQAEADDDDAADDDDDLDDDDADEEGDDGDE